MQNSQDARKSKLYGKIGKLIVQAVKAGGPDMLGNPRLKDALKQAQQASVPKDIIDRNIKRASDKNQADFQEVDDAPHVITTLRQPYCQAYSAVHACTHRSDSCHHTSTDAML